MADLTREEVIEKVGKGESLKGMDLKSIPLNGADLSKANFIDAFLSGADLSGTNLSSALLCNAVFNSAELISVDLSNADLTLASLNNANLSNANLRKADLSEANLSKANLYRANFNEADLRDTNLIGADLRHTNLSGANLSGVNLRAANLSDTDLCGVNLSAANLSGVNLSGTDLRYAYLIDANLSNANLRKADLHAANISSANLSGVNLSGANLSSSDLECAILSKADISGANIFHYKTHGWKIEGIKCTHVYSYSGENDDKEKSCRKFSEGEFEEIYKLIPTIDICFSNDFNNLDYLRLADIQEKIRLEMPDIGLRLKKMERKGFDMVVTLEAKEENQIEDVSRKINELYKDKELEQLFMSQIEGLLKQKVLPSGTGPSGGLTFAGDINIGKIEFNMPSKIINADGKGSIVNIDSQFEKSAIGHSAIVKNDYSRNYFTNQVAVDNKFEQLRKEVSEGQQKLIDALVENLKKKQNSRAQDIWEQLKEGVNTSASAVSIVKTLTDLLGFTQ